MKKIRNILSVALATALAVSVLAGCGDKKPKVEAKGQVVVGTTTDPSGDMVPYWKNAGSDYDAYSLTTGYPTVALNKDSAYVYNETVLKSHETVENSDGSKTWNFEIKKGLKWSNGEEIKAQDYVFTVLFWSSKVIATDLGAANADYGLKFKGYDAFSKGENPYFEGVKLDGDYKFSITVDKKNLPHYFEMSMAVVTPTYMKGWVPEDVKIISDEKGARFSEEFTAAHIKDKVEEFRWKPTAFSGPYVMEGFDTANLAYTLKANKEFLGNYEGQVAQIETVILKRVQQTTMLDELKTNQIQLLPEVTDGDVVVAGLDLVDNDTNFSAADYERNGYGHITFVSDVGPTQFKEVRQAVAYLLNRNEFAKTFTKGYGAVVHGAYGLAMYESKYNSKELAALNQYNYSPEEANKVLEAGGWTLDAQGNKWSGTGLRHKKLEDGTLMSLKLNWASSENNSVSDLIATMLAKNPDVATAGMEIEQTTMTFDEMYGEHYMNQDEDYYNMYNLATGYTTPVFDVELSYGIDSPSNFSHINDEQLAKLAKEMLLVDSENEAEYMGKWLQFQKRFNELLPILPLYSNTYADFYTSNLKGYENVTALWNWTEQILYSTIE